MKLTTSESDKDTLRQRIVELEGDAQANTSSETQIKTELQSVQVGFWDIEKANGLNILRCRLFQEKYSKQLDVTAALQDKLKEKDDELGQLQIQVCSHFVCI